MAISRVCKGSKSVGLFVSNSNMHRFYIPTYPSILYTKQYYLLVRIILYINYPIQVRYEHKENLRLKKVILLGTASDKTDNL